MENFWDEVGYVSASEHRARILHSLKNGPIAPKNISEMARLPLSRVSFILKELTNAGLVECLNPRMKKGRMFSLTKRGKSVLEKLPNFPSRIRKEVIQRPLEFVDAVESGRHVVLFYEDYEYGRTIEFRYIKNGLLKGECCLYCTVNEDPVSVEREMEDSGIDVENFRKRNLLYIRQVPNPLDDPEGVSRGVEKMIHSMLPAGSMPPYRMRIRWVPKLNSEKQIVADMEIERDLHAALTGHPVSKHYTLFENLKCPILCPYNVVEIEADKRSEWMIDLLQNHNDAIFAPKRGEGIAFNMR